MIVCSIDLKGGEAVQLRQGKEHVLTSPRHPLELAAEFNRYGEIAVIDLDAALGIGDNMDLIYKMCRVADVRAGGGIRDEARGSAYLRAGAQKIIIGTAAEPELLSKFPADRVMVALDHNKKGEVLDRGWTHKTGENLIERANRLAPYCSGFLCTFVENEGGMSGLELQQVEELKAKIPHPITIAGGTSTSTEVAKFSKLGCDVQVGMALYLGLLNPVDAILESLDFSKQSDGLIPTVVQEVSGQVLMLAYSSEESLRQALTDGKGVYFSRSRNEIWEKGKTSGNSQELIACRTDCDRDALIFTVTQKGPACHTGQHACFGLKHFSMHTLFDVLKSRRKDLPESSYSAKFFKDRKKLVRKIMEEAFEVATSHSQENLRWEIADALYFMSLLAVDEGLEWSDVIGELRGRHR